MTSPYITVAEDIEWLRDEWLPGHKMPSPPELRRGSATLRRILVNGLVHEAWHFHGLDGAPCLVGPDLIAILESRGREMRHVVSAIAGGGVRGGISTAAMSLCIADNPATGVSADAEESFAVVVDSIARDAKRAAPQNEFTAAVEKFWKVGAYLNAAGAVRHGTSISRSAIIQYFANYAGGVHLDKVGKSNPQKHAQYSLIEELEGSTVFDLNGVYFELFSIGQAVGASQDFQQLALAIRENRNN